LAPSYDFVLVAVSIAIAILAAHTAFDLASRIAGARGSEKIEWLIAGATIMGMGVWAMHFVGMLALRLPMRVGFDLAPTLISMLPAIAAAGFALHVLQRDAASFKSIAFGGALMGAGIGAMHYIGMSAMRMSPPTRYDPLLFALSLAWISTRPNSPNTDAVFG
jgi:diguanylate cyclase